MHKVTLAFAVLGSAVSVLAQNCTGAPAAQTFSNRAEFAASFYYNIGSHIFDLNVQVPVTITGAKTWLYDQGVGQPVVPNQVGNTAIVDVYTCPTTRLLNETNAPTNPGSPWTLLGSGTITVVNTGVGNGESPIVFVPPLVLPAGAYGVVFRYNAPTAGTNPGPLHCLGVNPNPATPYTDPYMTMSNDGIQGTAWTGTGTDSPNLRINYIPAATSAQHVALGEGCYFSPQAFYENFPSPTVLADLSNTSQSWINLGPSYLVIPAAHAYVPPTSTALSAGPYGSSSSANWDDALSTPILLPFAFPFPGGSTNEVTVSSNGAVLLANFVNNSYTYCGAAYGSIVGFRDGPPRISPYHHDLDPTVGGGVYYEADPLNQFVRVTWENVQEWGVAVAVNTLQVTLYPNGNVDVFYGPLSNQSSGNNAIAGFTPGNGARMAPPIDISASLPYQGGDGRIPPVLTMDGRPVIGTSPNVVTTNITPGTFGAIYIFGLTGLASPISLAPFGMPGCSQYIVPFTSLFLLIGGNGNFSQALGIPNDPSFQSTQMFAQTAVLTGGQNAAGVLASNGLCMKFGQ